MADLRIVLNREGVRELLQSSEMQDLIMSEVQAVAERAGAGFVADTRVGKTRIQGAVSAATNAAYRDNMKNNTLLKALG